MDGELILVGDERVFLSQLASEVLADGRLTGVTEAMMIGNEVIPPFLRDRFHMWIVDMFLTPDFVTQLNRLPSYEVMKGLGGIPHERSNSVEYDPQKVEWLKKLGFKVPEEWIDINVSKYRYHPMIVTSVIVMKWVLKLREAIDQGKDGLRMSRALSDNVALNRVDYGGMRGFADDETFTRVDEFCRIHDDSAANTEARVSPAELLLIKKLIEESYS